MTNDQLAEDATLASVLHRYALRAPLSELGTEIGLGMVTASVALWLRPGSWVAWLCLGLGLAMLGLWAWADRAVERTSSQGTPSWRLLRGIAALIGISAALVAAFAMVSRLLGTWIS